MAKTVIYKGPAINLGRFGEVQDGQCLVMTDREFEDVSADKRFSEPAAELAAELKAKEAETIRKANVEQAKKDEVARLAFAKRMAEENGTAPPVAPADSAPSEAPAPAPAPNKASRKDK